MKKTDIKLPKIAHVFWRDACCFAFRGVDEGEMEDILTNPERRSVIVSSVGEVLADDEHGIILVPTKNTKPTAGDADNIEDFDYPLCIPKAYIIRKKYLK